MASSTPADSESLGTDLFGSAFLARLEKLNLLYKRLAKGGQIAERRSVNLGASQEFADYRNYVRGDDLRRIDWNVYGRLERLFVKLYESEEDLAVDILIDGSASMRWAGFGDSSKSDADELTKLDYARLIAASLGYIALSRLDRVRLHFFAGRIVHSTGRLHGKSAFPKMLAELSRLPELPRETGVASVLDTFLRKPPRPDLCVVISDFLDPDRLIETLEKAAVGRTQVVLVQTLHPREWAPVLDGSYRLQDAETHRELDSRLSAGALENYRDRLRQFAERIERTARQRGIGYVRVLTDVPFEQLILRVMREQGVLR